VNFETGSAQLTALSKYELDNLVEAMKKKAGMQVLLAGHTDNVGKTDENLSLSQKRAQIVAEYLSSKGISTSRLQAKGYGDAQPLAANDSDANREKNRRTEFRVVAQ
jgi:outer membrane protein OmpA-like peptidoglycan-associated protein